MLLSRMGNKRRIATRIIENFPDDETIRLYIEPFFGAGGLFFKKPKSKYNILNDNDSEVYNLFKVVSERREALESTWKTIPISFDLFQEWKNTKPKDPVMRACRFLFLSNFTYLCKGGTLMYNRGNAARLLHDRIAATQDYLFGCEFSNFDFRDLFKKVAFRSDGDRKAAFIYADPPYLGTANNYETGFKEKDSEELFDVLESTGARFAMSEFDHPFILAQAEKRGLRVIEIGERQNIKNRRVEILVVNY